MTEQKDKACLHDLHAACCGGKVGRRDVLDFMAAGGLAAMLAGLAPRAAQAQDDVLRIAYLPITDAAPLLVAHALGFFEQEGIRAERPTLMRGWAPLVEGFTAGRFNLVHLLKPIPVWMRYNNDFPVKILGWAHTNGSALVVGRHVDATDFDGLGGRQIAVPFWYSMHNIVLQYALRQKGITPVIRAQGALIAPNECNLQILPPSEMPAALAARKIDGYIVAEPFNALGELKAGARMLRFTGDIWKNHPCCVLCMNEAVINARPEWVQGVMNALVRATDHIASDKAGVAHMLSADGEGYLPAPAEVVTRAMTLYADEPSYVESGAIRNVAEFGNGRIDFDPYPYPSATRLIIEMMKETVVSGEATFLRDVDPDFVATDLVDDRFVRVALEASGRTAPMTRTEVVRL